jgi:ankyrin repeat protein
MSRSRGLVVFYCLLTIGGAAATALHTAVARASLREVKALLKHDPKSLSNIDVNTLDRGNHVLHIAITMGVEKRWGIIDALLEAGADANMKDARGMTPLFLAVSQESFETVVKLLEKKVLCASRAPFPWRCWMCMYRNRPLCRPMSTLEWKTTRPLCSSHV